MNAIKFHELEYQDLPTFAEKSFMQFKDATVLPGIEMMEACPQLKSPNENHIEILLYENGEAFSAYQVGGENGEIHIGFWTNIPWMKWDLKNPEEVEDFKTSLNQLKEADKVIKTVND